MNSGTLSDFFFWNLEKFWFDHNINECEWYYNMSFSRINKTTKLPQNDHKMAKKWLKMKGKYHSLPLMTNIL